MVNTQLFQTLRGKLLPAVDTVNHHGAGAYALSPRHQLAQFAATGCLNATYYANAEAQLATVMELCEQVEPEFIAKTAVYCRERGYMKDMPALLTAVLASKSLTLFAAVFGRTITNGKMLRNFAQVMRSGAAGRRSLGTRPKKLIQHWLNTASEQALLSAAVGQQPSLADVVKMVHPKPAEPWRAAFFAWLIGKPYMLDDLPPSVRAFECYKRDRTLPVPNVPFQMLTALELDTAAWTQIARQGGWQMVRMNLNTFARHGVFDVPGMPEYIADVLRDPHAIAGAKVFPYQLMSAYVAAGDNIPGVVKAALEDALDLALSNVPTLSGRVVVCPDVSGSMQSAVTGYRAGGTSSVRCIDVAALTAAALMRNNPSTRVMPFEVTVKDVQLQADAGVLHNARTLASIGGGGTNCSAPLTQLNRERAKADLVIFVSDNESWIDATRRGASATMKEWNIFKQRNPGAKLVCIDVQPHGTSQAPETRDILNVGGFSDDVFKILAAFASGQLGADHWVGEIEAVSLY